MGQQGGGRSDGGSGDTPPVVVLTPAAVRATGRIILMASVAAIGGFLFGFDTAVINGAVPSVAHHFGVGPFVLGLSVSAALIGSAVGALTAGRLADHFGRIPVMVAAAILFVVQSFGVGLAFTVIDFSIWRFVGGIAVGAASVIAPAYIAESAPADMRGRLGSFQQLAIVSGIFIAALVDFALAAAAGGADHTLALGLPAWRWMFLSEVIPAAIYLVGALSIPESPRYLVATGQTKEARVVLVNIVGDAQADGKVAEIQRTLSGERKPRFSDLRGRYGLLPIVWVGIGLSVFQQFVGINVIFYYSSVLWQAVGFSQRQALTITVITNLTNVVTTLVAIATIDRLGRKPLLLIGSVGMVVTLGTMAFLFGTAPLNSSGQPVLHGTNGPIALVAANLYVFAFGMSWGPVVWVLLGEMFPNRIRAAALGLAASMQWVANFLVSTTFPVLKNVGLGYAYGLYALAAALSFVFVVTLIHETRGRELESMGVSARPLRQAEPTPAKPGPAGG
jgi:MFS transporter, SP family, sugar:H+ symporter